MKKHHSFILLMVLFLACSNEPKELPELDEHRKAQVRDYLLRCDTGCQGPLVLKWGARLEENGENHYMVEVDCHKAGGQSKVYRVVILKDSSLRIDKSIKENWVPFYPTWRSAKEFGFVESIEADTVSMLDVGEKFRDRAEMFTGKVIMRSKKTVIHCDTLYWRNSDRILLVPGRVVIQTGDSSRVTGRGLEMDARGEKWSLQGVFMYEYPSNDALEKNK